MDGFSNFKKVIWSEFGALPNGIRYEYDLDLDPDTDLHHDFWQDPDPDLHFKMRIQQHYWTDLET